MMTTYQKRKEAAREKAIAWQHEASQRGDLSYMEFAEAAAYFEELGKRYGLTREFRENGII